jgi:ATP-dependent protease ClpP protease subunit
MGDSDATIIVSVEGQCCSAATIIALAADMVELSNHCVWMCHNYSSGMIGKGHELHSQAEFERDWSIKLMKDIYDGFLSESEIQRMLNGADLWMGADDVMERLNKRQKRIQKKNKSKN